MQSDFQRTFIMLRPLDVKDSASSGFCRVERKNNRGKLVFSVQGVARGGTLHAMLMTQDARDREMKVIPCGEIRVDARGAGTVTYQVENMTATAVSNCRIAAVASASDVSADLLMMGFFGTGKPIDREALERAAVKALGIDAAAPKETPRAPEDNSLREALEEKPVLEAVPDATPAEPPAVEVSPPPDAWPQPVIDAGDLPALGLPEEVSAVAWPDSVLPLRELFERFSVVSHITGEENEIFISIPMNGGTMGIDHYLLGVRVENNAVSAIGYGVPGAPSAPPVGLEGYTWRNTPVRGYWMKWEEAAVIAN